VSRARVIICLCVLLALLGLNACGGRASGATITVAGANSTEHKLATALTVELLKARGFKVVERTEYGDPVALRAALVAGDIDLCWEFTGETWLSHLAHDQPITDAAMALEMLRADDAASGIAWVAQAGYHSSMSMWVRLDMAIANGLITLSDLANYTRSVNARTRLCTPEELYRAVQGIRGLTRAYGLSFDESLVRFGTASEGYRALGEGQCDCALASSLEDLTAAGPLRALQDDREFFQASNLAVGVRAAVLAEHPELQEVLSSLASALTQEAMADLYRQVAVERKEPAKVAKSFLKDSGLDKPAAQTTTQ
jgi:osmoprotectant transport system substrate-binding protein